MESNKRLQRSALSYGAQMSFTLITLAISIFATPKLIRWLGNEQLGTVRTATDWAGYLSLTELGLGGAMTAVLAAALHSGDPQRIENAMAACLGAYRRVALATVAFGVLLVLVIPHLVFHGVSVSPALISALRWAAALNVIAATFIFFTPLRTIWDVNQRGYVVVILNIVQSVVTTAAALILAYKGYGIVGQAAAVLLGLMVLFGLLVLITVRNYPWVLRSTKLTQFHEQSRDLRKLNWPTLALNLANRVSFLSDNLVVAYFFGPSMVVPFFITQRLVQLAMGQLQTVGNVTWAGLVQLRQVEGLDLFNRRLLEISRLITVLGVILLVPIFAYDESFVRRWVGESQFGGTGIVLLAVLNSMLFALPSFWGWVFTGTGLVAKMVPVSIVAATVNVVASILATFILGHWSPRLGMLGPLLGTTTANVTCYAWWMPLLLKRNFGTSIRAIVISIGRPILVGASFAIVLFEVARWNPPQGWLALALEMGAATMLLMILCWCFAINSDERAIWQARFQANVGTRFQKR